MYCKNCGNKIPDGAKFCGKCGAVMDSSTDKESTVPDKRKKQIAIIAGVIGVVVLTVGLVMAGRSFFQNPKEEIAEEGSRVTDENGNVIVTERNIAEANPIKIENLASVDLGRRDHTPGEKISGTEWDETFFYWLEDTDSLSDENDNYISKCHVTHYQMYRGDSGRNIEYEVYTDPESGAVHKIVSIEQMEDGQYELVDYYYVDGKPNFIFQRYDSVYTPTYATLKKPGMRYYFNDDTLVRSRHVGDDLKVSQTGLAFQNKQGYEEFDYFEAPEAVKEQYDELEMEWLNKAYNTYDAVRESKSIGIVRGKVQDTTGNVLSGYQIYVQNTEDGNILYQTETEADGSFCMYVYLDGKDCQLYVAGNETYEGTYVYGISLEASSLYYSYDPLILHRLDGDSYPVFLHLCNAEELDTGAEVFAGGVTGAEIVVRKGTDARQGAAICESRSDESGAATLTLGSGSYTAEISCEGYATNYINLEVTDSALSQNIYMIKAPSEGQTAILMTWSSEMGKDLDLTIFTPYQAEDGDMAHIGGSNLSDEYGNHILHDNSMGCEVAYLDTTKAGSFKIYVNDYTDSMAGDYDIDIYKNLDVHVYIYLPGGYVTELHVPVDENGIVWEVAELSGSRLSVTGRIYVQPTGKRWWVEDKAEMVWMPCKRIYSYEDGTTRIMLSSEFDEAGRPLQSRLWDDYERFQYTQDTENNVLNVKLFRNDGSGSEYEYDSNGNTIRSTGYNSDGSISSQCEYDSHGNRIRYTCYDSDGSILYWAEYEYDSHGNEIRSTDYDSDGSISSRYETEYDSNGNEIRSTCYDSDGSILFWDETEYDSNGNEIRSTRYDSDGSISDQDEYDSNGNVIRNTWHVSDGSIRGRNEYEYEYDSNGNVIRSTRYGSDGSIFYQNEYEYDSHGNLIRDTQYNSKGSHYITMETEYVLLPVTKMNLMLWRICYGGDEDIKTSFDRTLYEAAESYGVDWWY